MTVHYLERPQQPRLAYVHTKGAGPLVVFLGGFKSDMTGTKATWLERQAIERGQAFLRFDYSGHGMSEGAFKDGTIGSWRRDALDVINHVADGPIVLTGSSMGGWIGLSIVLEKPQVIQGFVGIAAAPDFTDHIYDRMTDEQRARFDRDGFIEEPNDYSPEPYIFTKALLEDGRRNLILDRTHDVTVPMRLVQGQKDEEVDWRVPDAIKHAFPAADVQITLIEDGDHRLSRPMDLQILDEQIVALSKMA